MLYLLLAVAVVCACVAAYSLRHRAQWDMRPHRMCLACDATAQPSRNASRQLVCASCGAPGPVPLDSPDAVARRAARIPPPAATPPVKQWVPRPKDDITRYG